MAPLFLWIAFTMVYPLFYGIQLSLTDQRLIGIEGTYIGIKNYLFIFKHEVFRSGLINSLIWTFLTGTLWGGLGILTGIMLQRTVFARNAMRIWILFPWIIPTIAVAILWKWLLSATYGIVNYLLVGWGILDVGFGFLSSPDYALEIASFIGAWRGFPFLAIIVLAGLLSIPTEEYEAARIDGANFLQELRFITFPYMKPTLTVLFLVGYMWAFNNFDMLWLLNQGGPAGATRTLPLIVYEWGFRNYFLGRASAVGVVMLAVQVLFMIGYMRLSRGAVGIFAPTERDS
jgi:multiple sugar transport system permease protein